MTAIMINNTLQNIYLVLASLAAISIGIYRFGWRLMICRDLTELGWKRTGLLIAAILASMVFIVVDSLKESICYSLSIIVPSFILGGIPTIKKENPYIVSDRRDFREGKTLWEKIKIWVFY